jgi:predicted DNA-binding transcriptional regulator AlpA
MPDPRAGRRGAGAAASAASVIPFAAPRASEMWLTKPQLAERLLVSQRWIDYRRREGMPSHKWGGIVRFRLSEVESWLDRRTAA